MAHLRPKFDTELETIQLPSSSLLFLMAPFLQLSQSVQLELGSSPSSQKFLAESLINFTQIVLFPSPFVMFMVTCLLLNLHTKPERQKVLSNC